MHPRFRKIILIICTGLSLLLSALWVDGYFHNGQLEAAFQWITIGLNWSCGRISSTVRFPLRKPDPPDIRISHIRHEETFVKSCRDRAASPGSVFGMEAHYWPDPAWANVYQLVIPISYYLALLLPFPIYALIRYIRARKWAGDRVSLLKPGR